jgi:thiol:disulfide interchange protein DsbD
MRLATRGVAVVVLVTALAAVLRGAQGRPEGVLADEWQTFSPSLVAQLRAEGRPVFVDFTAAWCITCQVDERVILSSDEIREAFTERNVALLKADWTRFDPMITEALESFGRSGVPLYVLYPGGPGGSPIVLPTILTKQGVIDALDDVAAADAGRHATADQTEDQQ